MKKPQLTEKDHRNMDIFLGSVLDYYKSGRVDKNVAVSTLAHVMAALDVDNYGEVINWLEQGRKFILEEQGGSNLPGFDAALNLLLGHARKDTGGGRRCAMFLLSLWNGDTFKADLQELMYINADIFDAMILVYRTLYERNQQLENVVTEGQIKPIYKLWGSRKGR